MAKLPRATPLLTPVIVLASLLVGSRVGVSAQQPRFKRPALASGADTNDPAAYVALGDSLLATKRDRAIEALYWARRLNPNSADLNYKLGMAIRLKSAVELGGGIQRSWGSAEKSVERVTSSLRYSDSLVNRAIVLDPFVSRRSGVVAQQLYDAQLNGNDHLAEWMKAQESLPWTRGALYESRGSFEAALSAYGAPVNAPEYASSIHMARARLFRIIGNGDSAEVELAAAILTARVTDRSALSNQNYIYEAKSVLEFAFGSLCEEREDSGCAREAYGRALQEDLTFFPPHLRLARLALEAGDTTDAESELSLASDAAPDDPYVLVIRGSTLAQIGRYDAARDAFVRLAAVEPDYANGYLLLGRLHELQHRPGDAAHSYSSYLAHAQRNAPERTTITGRLATLQPENTR